ncbi:MAG: hypothetical protein JSS56_02420 [Proteobacteria bacterium]|nr:hypothetical protein [Pseudomonadota bacterium]
MHLKPSANYLAWKDASDRLRAAEAAILASGQSLDPEQIESLEKLRRETRVRLGMWVLEMQHRAAACH